jgi:chromosome segregation ATPase
MTGEINFFRKRFLGGFNREDVVSYISKLAQERNENREARAIAEEDARTLADEAEALRQKTEDAKKDADESRMAMESANLELQKLTEEVASLRFEIDEAKRSADLSLAAKDAAENDKRTLTESIESLRDGLEEARLAVEEGRRYKAEALEAKEKLKVLDNARKTFAELEPVFESLRAAFDAE